MSNDNLETKSDQICPLNVTLKLSMFHKVLSNKTVPRYCDNIQRRVSLDCVLNEGEEECYQDIKIIL